MIFYYHLHDLVRHAMIGAEMMLEGVEIDELVKVEKGLKMKKKLVR